MRPWLLLILAASTHATPRAVITFAAPSLNSAALTPAPDNVTEVKRYGRRLVVHLGRDMDQSDTAWLTQELGGSDFVVNVEPDIVVSIESEDALPVEIIEFLDVSTGENEHPIVAAPLPPEHETTDETTDETTYNEPQTTEDPDVFAADGSATQPPPVPWNLDDNEPYGLHIQHLRRTTAGNATVAIIDSGLASAGIREWEPVGGFDFISSTDYANDQTGRDANYTDPGDNGPTCPTPSWHGTRVASMVEQIAPGSALLILRVLGRCGSGFANDVTDAIVWSAGGIINGVATNKRPAHIISMSFAGAGACPTYLQSAVNTALAAGSVLVAAAGNQGKDAANYFPGNCQGVLSIGATTRKGTLASYSNTGPTLAYTAPGGDNASPILTKTASATGTLISYNSIGTSFAAPHITGLLALLDPSQTRYLLNARFQTCPGNPNASTATLNCRVHVLVTDPHTVPIVLSSTLGSVNAMSQNSSDAMVQGQECFWSPHGENRHLNCIDPGYYIICQAPYPSCAQCIPGTYSLGYQDACTPCPQGLIAWSYGSTGCVTCPTNTYAPSTAGASNCICNAGYAHNSLDSGCYQCQAGFYSLGGTGYTCTQCAPGTYSGTGQSACQSCSPGTYNPGGLTACAGCAPGYATNSYGTQSCTPCGVGTYSPGSQATCQTCAANSYCDAGAATSTICPAGYFCSQGQRNTCAAGWCCQSTGLAQQTACPTGSYCLAQCTAPIPCDPGKLCLSGSSAQAPCPAGSTCTGGIATGTCPAGSYCPAGSSTPTGCPIGTYSAASGASAAATCTSCATGKYASTTGKSACDSCDVGTYASALNTAVCTACGLGSYNGLTAQTACTLCEPGSYATTTAKTACDKCATGSASSAQGAVTAATCVACAKGTYASAVGTVTCTQCSAGTYGTATSQTTAASCVSCPVGSFSGTAGLTTCALCESGTNAPIVGTVQCSACVLGYYSLAGASKCLQCDTAPCLNGQIRPPCTGKFNPVCTSCPPLPHCTYYTSQCTVDNLATGTPLCNCDAGFYMLNKVCAPCPSGTFSPIGTTACTPWSTADCPTGQFRTQGTPYEDSKCEVCPALPDNTIRDGVDRCTWRCTAGFQSA